MVPFEMCVYPFLGFDGDVFWVERACAYVRVHAHL